MAELLIFARDNGHDDPVKMQRGSWRAGHVVHVAPDGFQWAAGERMPDFWRIRVLGAPVSVFNDLLHEAHSAVLDHRGHPFKLARRILGLNFPDVVRQRLAQGDVVEMSLAELQSYRAIRQTGALSTRSQPSEVAP